METSHVNLGQGTVFLSFSLYWRQSFVADSRSDSLYRYWAIKIYSETYSDLHSISKMEAKRIRIEERKRLFINSTFLTPNLLLENENRFDEYRAFIGEKNYPLFCPVWRRSSRSQRPTNRPPNATPTSAVCPTAPAVARKFPVRAPLPWTKPNDYYYYLF